MGGVLALSFIFGDRLFIGHFVVPSDAGKTQSQHGFNGVPGQDGQRPHFNDKQSPVSSGADPASYPLR